MNDQPKQEHNGFVVEMRHGAPVVKFLGGPPIVFDMGGQTLRKCGEGAMMAPEPDRMEMRLPNLDTARGLRDALSAFIAFHERTAT